MLPFGEIKASNCTNKVFFANADINVAFDAIPIERKCILVFNPGTETLFLGNNDVDGEEYIEAVPPGKVLISDKFSSDAIYCTNLDSTTMIHGSDYY
jgi:hypothetical protein